MDAEKLNQALYEKMAAEQESYRDWLLTQSPEEILNHTYEYAVRQDIVVAMENAELEPAQAKALLSSPSPLSDVYQDFANIETGYMDILHECVENLANSIMETQREKNAVPLYRETGAYAMEHGEIEQFRASLRANIACRDAIDAEIRENFDGLSLNADTKDVLAQFGPERVSLVLAATLQSRNYDGRFSINNKKWAASIPVDTMPRKNDYLLNSHSGLVNIYVGKVRKELDAMREQVEKKPSIKAQLTAKSVLGGQPSKPKDREAR